METIDSRVTRTLDENGRLRVKTNDEVRSGAFTRVGDYVQLAKYVASLQFNNPHIVLLFRGQVSDHVNSVDATSIKPSLFRPRRDDGAIIPRSALDARFAELERAESYLLDEYARWRIRGSTSMQRQRLLRWAVLQHYEVCRTPLVDVTHSLRVAASFATHSDNDLGYVYVLGVPAISGAITASADAGLQVLRLASVCPPQAMRAHLQEGYLIGEYPELPGMDQKRNYYPHEIDCARRLVAKFELRALSFWRGEAFTRMPREALFPSARDPLLEITRRVSRRLGPRQGRRGA